MRNSKSLRLYGMGNGCHFTRSLREIFSTALFAKSAFLTERPTVHTAARLWTDGERRPQKMMAESWLICEKGYQTKCVDCPIRDENAEPCEHAIEVVPVRHGKWVHSHYENCSEQFEIVKCSCCGHEAYAMAFYVRGGNYCPNCGAMMDGGADDAADGNV